MMQETVMSQVKSILIALDFSEPSLNALDAAVYFAEKHMADIYIVNVREDLFDTNSISTTAGYTKNSSNVLVAIASDIQHKTKIKPVIIEEQGFVPEIILKNTVKYNCDLIVMGTYGASGYRNGYIGSNTYSIVKFGPCPVLLIPGGKRFVGFNKPLFPVRPVMAAVKNYDLLKNYLADNSTLYVLGLSPFAREGTIKDLNRVISEMQLSLDGESIDIKTQWNEGNAIADNILIQAEKNNADLIILTAAIDVGIKQFCIGPIAHRIIHNARTPLLIINKVNVYAAKAAAN
jgi:nucleotide-binding universal stress UspA family protein